MLDTDLLINALQKQGFHVESAHKVPDNAGDWEFMIGGKPYTLEQARTLLEESASKSGTPTT